MEYIVNGVNQLTGTVSLSGAKNVALKLIVAALLNSGTTVLKNVPRIKDVIALIDIINYLGGTVKFVDRNTLEIKNTLTKSRIPLEIAGKTRVSFLLIAPLLYRFGKASLPNPGGCRLGERPVDRLVRSIENLGVKIEYNSNDGFYYAMFSGKPAKEINFSKKTHTGTELVTMFASHLSQNTVINNAAQEPEIDDLINFLNISGAVVKRSGEKIIIKGTDKLVGCEYTIQTDRNEAVTFIVLSVLFKHTIKIKGVDIDSITAFLVPFRKAGYDVLYNLKTKVLTTKGRGVRAVDIETNPHPGFMTDWQPLWALLMTQINGISTIHETVFEDRFGYVEQLRKFGAKINYYQPKISNPEQVYQFNWTPQNSKKQAIKIYGVTKLHNAYAKMTDIRAGACLLLAALCSDGKSVISGAEQIERGYENLIDKLKQIGANIKIGE
jgi:UDP-N-acetylglucosamine 1-carboxyvinyltransferase